MEFVPPILEPSLHRCVKSLELIWMHIAPLLQPREEDEYSLASKSFASHLLPLKLVVMSTHHHSHEIHHAQVLASPKIPCLRQSCARSGQGMVLLRESCAGGPPWAHIHLCPGDPGPVHFQPAPQETAHPSPGMRFWCFLVHHAFLSEERVVRRRLAVVVVPIGSLHQITSVRRLANLIESPPCYHFSSPGHPRTPRLAI